MIFRLLLESSTGADAEQVARRTSSVTGLQTIGERADRAAYCDSYWRRRQVAHSDHVLGRRCEAEHQIDPCGPAMPSLTRVRRCLVRRTRGTGTYSRVAPSAAVRCAPRTRPPATDARNGRSGGISGRPSAQIHPVEALGQIHERHICHRRGCSPRMMLGHSPVRRNVAEHRRVTPLRQFYPLVPGDSSVGSLAVRR